LLRRRSSGTNPSSTAEPDPGPNLDWNYAKPGFVEIDRVGHDGGDARGNFCQSLDTTDIATDRTGPFPLRWTPDEIAAVPEHRRLTDGFD